MPSAPLGIIMALNPVREALLIKAQSRIVQLESEVSHLRQEAAAEEVKHDWSFRAKAMGVIDMERQHKLEHERSVLVEELAVMKTKLVDTEKLLTDSNEKCRTLSDSHRAETQALKGQVENLMILMSELDALNDKMQGELNEIQLLDPENQLEQVEELREHYHRSVQVLRRRLSELETTESKLLSSQTQIKHLQHQLSIYRQDSHFVESVKDKVLHYETLEHKLQLLTEENQSLCQDRANADLLRYQVQSLQQCCDALGEVTAEVARLRQENSELKQDKGQEASASALQIHLAELQQREIVSLSRYGELVTQLKVCQQECDQYHDQLQKAQKKLLMEKKAVAAGEERIQKLERRLIFVTKERDGCVTILNSFKVDSGVDGVMRELLAQKEQELEKSKQRIYELETALGDQHLLTKCHDENAS